MARRNSSMRCVLRAEDEAPGLDILGDTLSAPAEAVLGENDGGGAARADIGKRGGPAGGAGRGRDAPTGGGGGGGGAWSESSAGVEVIGGDGTRTVAAAVGGIGGRGVKPPPDGAVSGLVSLMIFDPPFCVERRLATRSGSNTAVFHFARHLPPPGKSSTHACRSTLNGPPS